MIELHQLRQPRQSARIVQFHFSETMSCCFIIADQFSIENTSQFHVIVYVYISNLFCISYQRFNGMQKKTRERGRKRRNIKKEKREKERDVSYICQSIGMRSKNKSKTTES